MKLSFETMVDKLIDRPLPRMLTCLALSGAVTLGTYEMMRGLEVSAADHNAGVEACARFLGEKATQVRAADLPDECKDFRTSFSYRDVTAHVVTRNGEGQSDTTDHQRTYKLPSVSNFRSANIETAADEKDQKSRDLEGAAIIGGVEFGLMFPVWTILARARRKTEKQEPAHATASA